MKHVYSLLCVGPEGVRYENVYPSMKSCLAMAESLNEFPSPGCAYFVTVKEVKK